MPQEMLEQDDGKRLEEPTESAAEVDASPPPRHRRRWLRRLLLTLGPLLVIIVGGYFYLTGGRYVDTDNAYVKADKVAVSAAVSGPIASVDVGENQHVDPGTVLFHIDAQPFRVALDRAEAQLQSVRADLESLKATYRQKTEELRLARINADFAERDLKRKSELERSKVVSQNDLDAARHEVDVARQQIAVIQQELSEIRARLGGHIDTPVEQHPRYVEARAARDAAALDLARTAVKAPFAGIASKTPEPGQYVNAGTPVMSVVADRGMWIDANFKETQLTHVQPGQSVSIRVDTYPDRVWHGKVESISQATGAEFSIIPPQNATGNWVKVVQRIPVRISIADEPDAPQLRVGMSTQLEIDTGRHRELPGFVQTALGWLRDFTGPGVALARDRQ